MSFLYRIYCPSCSASSSRPNSCRQYSAGQKAVYAFTPEITGVYEIRSHGDRDTFVTAYSEAAGGIWLEDDDGGEGGNFALAFRAEAGETCWFEVSFLADDMTGAFTVGLDLIRKAETGGEEEAEAEIRPGTPVQVEILAGGKVRTYRFVPAESGTYRITSNAVPDTVVAVRTADGWRAEDDDGGVGTNFSLLFPAYEGETYYVDIFLRADTATGVFPVELIREGGLPEPGAAYGDHPVTLRPGEEISLTLENEDDKAILVFTPEHSGFYTLSSFGDFDPYVSLFEGEAINDFAYDDDGDSDTAGNFALTVDLDAGTVYRYEVRLWSYAGFGTIRVRLDEAN